jgi:hypothetical protein
MARISQDAARWMLAQKQAREIGTVEHDMSTEHRIVTADGHLDYFIVDKVIEEKRISPFWGRF